MSEIVKHTPLSDVGGTERSPEGASGVPPTSGAGSGPERDTGQPAAGSAPASPAPVSVPMSAPDVGSPDDRPYPLDDGEEPDGEPSELPEDWQPADVSAFRRPASEQYPPDDEGLDLRVPGLGGPRKGGRRLAKAEPIGHQPYLTPEQRLLVLDTWRRSGLPAGDFAELVGMSKHTLYAWKKKFELEGPAGLMDKPKGTKGSKLPDIARRAILMLKEDHPDWGCQRISDMLLRGPGLAACPTTVGRVLRDEGYELVEQPTQPHPDRVRRFERARPNQLWQTDLFTFMLKRQNRRVYLVAFMDDHSRYMISYGLHASQSAALVLEVFRAGIASCGAPEEVLTDNGAQYVTWRGTSAFAKELQKRGIRHVVASPRRPQTLGKIERFWGTLWRECLEAAVFIDLADAQARIGHFIDYYNFRRAHQGLEGLVPADRFFQLAPQVKETLAARVAANALELARNGLPKAPFYLTGQAGGSTFSVHAEGERVILSRDGQKRQEIDLTPPPAPPESMPQPVCSQGLVSSEALPEEDLPPGVSPLDDGLRRIQQSLESQPPTGGQP